MRTSTLTRAYKAATLLVVLFFVFSASAQTLIEWPLDGNQLPSPTTSTDFTGEILTTGDNISTIMYTSSSAREAFAFSVGWSTDSSIDPQSYYQVCFAPNAGKTITMNSLEFSLKSAATIGGAVTGPQDFEVHWSIDNFEHSNLLYTGTSTATATLHQVLNWDKTICDGQQICIRWYGYNSTSTASSWDFIKNSIKIIGTVDATCTPPTAQGTVAISNITSGTAQINCNNGTGTHRLVVAKLDEAVDWMPCSGESFTANSQFGLGAELGAQNFVIYNGPATGVGVTSFNLSGLEQGRDYHIAVFEYNNVDNCYLQTNPARANFTTTCASATDVSSPLAYGFSGSINLFWDSPYCFNDILVIASESPITGSPSGSGSSYAANGQYGLGTDSGSDFPAGEYPVYRGTGNASTVTGLSLNTGYYFKIFARLGVTWSAGVEIDDISADGCPELNGDVIFINELHYKNSGTDANEGIEVFGPANVDLSGYQIHFYKQTPGQSLHQTFDKMISLTGVVDDEGDGFGAIWFDVPDIFDQIGAVCLYNSNTGHILQFLSYRADQQVADDGIAMGMTATGMYDAGITTVAGENAGTQAEESMQLFGTGSCPSDFTWEVNVQNTRGMLNINQQVLPIELLYFEALVKNKLVKIEWATAIEKNNDYMVVQRSADGSTFEDLQVVKGAGNSFAPIYYEIIDQNPLVGTSYYRLKQVDYDGTTVYHKISAVYIEHKLDRVQIYPTIASQSIHVVFKENIIGETNIKIFDINGQQLITQQVDLGTQSLNIPVTSLSQGIYFVNIQTNNTQQTFKIIKN